MFSILFLAIFGLAMLGSVVGQATLTDDELRAMSDDELEKVCLVRGFEILRDEIDPSTGLPFELTHDDFVEAAKRCLEIEQEMNDLLAEYPELAAEVEEEIKKLEAEQMARQTEVDKLEKDLEKAEAAAAESASSSSGAAFVPPVNSGETVEGSASNNEGLEEEACEQNAAEEANDEASSLNEPENPDPDLTVQSLPEDKAEEPEILEEIAKSSETDMASKNETVSEDFTISTITFEFIRAVMKQLESDVKRIVELVGPVVGPILQAGDVAWRHIKVTFESLRRKYSEESGRGQRQEEDTVPA